MYNMGHEGKIARHGGEGGMTGVGGGGLNDQGYR